MNTNLLNIVKQIIAEQGEGILDNPQRLALTPPGGQKIKHSIVITFDDNGMLRESRGKSHELQIAEITIRCVADMHTISLTELPTDYSFKFGG